MKHALSRWICNLSQVKRAMQGSARIALALAALCTFAFLTPSVALGGVSSFTWLPCPQGQEVRETPFGQVFCSGPPTTSSRIVQLGGCTPVLGDGGLPVDFVCLAGRVDVTTEVGMIQFQNGIGANVFVSLDQVSGTSQITGERYRAVGADATSIVQLDTPSIPDLTFTFRLLQVGVSSVTISQDLQVDLSDFALDASDQLVGVTANLVSPCASLDLCGNP